MGAHLDETLLLLLVTDQTTGRPLGALGGPGGALGDLWGASGGSGGALEELCGSLYID